MLLFGSTKTFINVPVFYYSKVIKKIAIERMRILYNFSRIEPVFADRYAELIRRISAKSRTKIPLDIKRRICKKCGHMLFPGKNMRARTSKTMKTVNLTCLDCGNIMRFPYSREKVKK